MTPLAEVCVESVDDIVAAQQGGAERVELCASLLEGGLTPSIGTVDQAMAVSQVLVHAMVRPRGGDFVYSDNEFAIMLQDVAAFRHAGVDGVVFGALLADGTIDVVRTRALVMVAGSLGTVFHRAFDMVADAGAALEALIACGVERVLTSGQKPLATEGAEMLRTLKERAAGRITVMGCGGLRPDNIADVRRRTGLHEYHFSAMQRQESPMVYRNPAIAMGGAGSEREYQRNVTSQALVRATVDALRGA